MKIWLDSLRERQINLSSHEIPRNHRYRFCHCFPLTRRNLQPLSQLFCREINHGFWLELLQNLLKRTLANYIIPSLDPPASPNATPIWSRRGVCKASVTKNIFPALESGLPPVWTCSIPESTPKPKAQQRNTVSIWSTPRNSMLMISPEIRCGSGRDRPTSSKQNTPGLKGDHKYYYLCICT